MDQDLRSIQQARALLESASAAQHVFKEFTQESVDHVVDAMVKAGANAAEVLAKHAHEETGFGRVDSKTRKNLFATKTLGERMRDMRTCGIIAKKENGTIWEIATPMGVIAALIPSTNPTSTAMYKAIIAAKARCGIVMSPHPRAKESTARALQIVAEAAYRNGAPEGLFGCMTEISLQGTEALLEDSRSNLILATGGSAMVRAAYSKGKPAYGVGSGNVPVYVDRSADLEKASQDILYGASFDYGTLCSTERSIVADLPVKNKLLELLRKHGGYILSEQECGQLRDYIYRGGALNIEQVGKAPPVIAAGAGFSVPPKTKALIAEVDTVGKDEPLSMETLSPILSFYTEDGWEAGCERCKSILAFGGIGHTLGLHCLNDRIIEAFALEKPAMRIVVNTVCALGSVGYTNRLFPAMTLGPGTLGGSITSDNISPLHLVNIKRLAFETSPIHLMGKAARTEWEEVRTRVEKRTGPSTPRPPSNGESPWMAEIDARLRARAGNPVSGPRTGSARPVAGKTRSEAGRTRRKSEQMPASKGRSRKQEIPSATPKSGSSGAVSIPPHDATTGSLSEDRIAALVSKFRK